MFVNVELKRGFVDIGYLWLCMCMMDSGDPICLFFSPGGDPELLFTSFLVKSGLEIYYYGREPCYWSMYENFITFHCVTLLARHQVHIDNLGLFVNFGPFLLVFVTLENGLLERLFSFMVLLSGRNIIIFTFTYKHKANFLGQ